MRDLELVGVNQKSYIGVLSFESDPSEREPCYLSLEICQKETSNCITSKLQVSNKYFSMSDLPGPNQGYVSMSMVDQILICFLSDRLHELERSYS